MLKRSLIIVLCTASFALPSPDVVAAIAAQTAELVASLTGQTAELTGALTTQTTLLTDGIKLQTTEIERAITNQTTALKEEIKDDTTKILTAITQTKDSLNAPNASINKLKTNIKDLDKILDNREYTGLLKGNKYIQGDYISKYCENFKDNREKYACYASFGASGVSLVVQGGAYDDLNEFSKTLETINSARVGSQDIKESTDISNAISSEALALKIYLANKDIAEKAAKAKGDLEKISAKNQAIDNVGKKINMKELLK